MLIFSGQEAQALEREAEAAQTEANQNESEIERLLNHAMARAVYRFIVFTINFTPTWSLTLSL